MRELRGYWRARRLHLPSVSPFDDDSVAALDEVLREHCEVLYVGHETLKDPFGDGLCRSRRADRVFKPQEAFGLAVR